MITLKRVVCAGAALGVITLLQTSSAGGPEVMTDRCSGEVVFAPSYDAKPTAHGAIVLKRQHDGYSPASTFNVKPDKDGYVRWWCHSTTGNVFDPGTWRVHVDNNAVRACLVSVAAPVAGQEAQCLKTITLSSSAFEGWTPERSRCDSHSGHLRARLGPERLLTTECL